MNCYNNLRRDEKLKYMNYAAQWLSLKPELIDQASQAMFEIDSDEKLIKRLDGFAKTLYEYLPTDENVLPPRP
jgi:hypothetical protein